MLKGNKKLLTVFVAFAMVSTIAVTIIQIEDTHAGVAPPEEDLAPRVAFEMNASDDEDMYIVDGRLRVYGECDAIYPTQSYRGVSDFIYPNYVDPFDPGVLAKDSVTFNPALIDLEYFEPSFINYTTRELRWENETIRVNGGDSSEKVFLRMFYEPCYSHGVDYLMDSYSNVDLHPTDTFDAIVVETTYFLVDANRNPVAGYPPGEDTHFVLPYSVYPFRWIRPGMSMAGIVDLAYASGEGTSQLTDGVIEVEKSFEDVPIGAELNFMDHNISITDITETAGTRINMEYVGNMWEQHAADRTHYGLAVGDKEYFNRANQNQSMTDPAYRWYMRIDWETIDPDDPSMNTIDITLGRRLAAGETFYVNGVRYDMPAIYVTDDGAFKYITLQTPLPKCYPESPLPDYKWETTVTDNWEDWSHVTSQWLANVLIHPPSAPTDYEYVWFLPPFIDYSFVKAWWAQWTMIDDIGLLKNNTLWDQDDIDIEIPEKGLIVDKGGDGILHDQNSLEDQVYWVEQEDYEPFNTSLAQRLYVDEDEEWDWWNIYTQPIHYTLFKKPDYLESTSDRYLSDDIPGWYKDFLNFTYGDGDYRCDGNEYLVTTSFIAPNAEEDERHAQSKSDWDVHDIVDRASTIANDGDTSRDAYYWMPRVVFQKDCAPSFPPVYIDNSPGSVYARVFGECDAIYPTQSWSGVDDYIYPNYQAPFDPGVIAKDSVTFNPAFIDLEYWEPYLMNYTNQTMKWLNWTNETIRVNGGDSSEKVFLRLFYEPCYSHGVDYLMDSYSNVDLHPTDTFDALVVETTYFLVDANRNPVAGYPPGEDTHFVLPYSVYPGQWVFRPGMTMAGILDLAYASGEGTSLLTDGVIEVEMSFEDVPIGATLNFMDHNISITDITETAGTRINMEYVGNMWEQHTADRTHYGLHVGDKQYFNRANQNQPTSDPAYRWYMRIDWETIDPDDPSMNTIDITLGRRLAAGETFYVNGVRYDMPAIYVTDDGAFKYITLQTPQPKCEYGSPLWETPVTDNWEDWSHVTSQWLANVPQGDYNSLWFLPPFIDSFWAYVPWSRWTMVDDIGLLKNNTLWDQDDIDIEIPEKGLIVNETMNSLEGSVWWEEQYNYTMFNTSLAQRLYVEGEEEWDWWNIYTKPIHYTLLHFPDLEQEGMLYDPDDIPGWYKDFLNFTYNNAGYFVDGAEYLLTTSWLAPNSEDEERHAQSKSDWDVHDIIGNAEVAAPPSDWNPWDDDQVITTIELQEIINHWANDIPKNGHLITTPELQSMIAMWLAS